ncbi:MAG: DNA starvation/stationary phase protection protein [Bdellovibrionota bacterium]
MKSAKEIKQYVPVQDVDQGIEPEYGADIAKSLNAFLADTYALYIKTQNFHWNIKGLMFYPLHQMFEDHYRKLADAVDEIAERITSLGHYANGSFESYNEQSHISGVNQLIPARDMLMILTKDHKKIVQLGRGLCKHVSIANDEVTLDLIVQHMRMHEKMAWMLRASAQDVLLVTSDAQLINEKHNQVNENVVAKEIGAV